VTKSEIFGTKQGLSVHRCKLKALASFFQARSAGWVDGAWLASIDKLFLILEFNNVVLLVVDNILIDNNMTIET